MIYNHQFMMIFANHYHHHWIHFILLSSIITHLLITQTFGLQCMDSKCDCIFISNKLNANCGSLGLTQLPKPDSDRGEIIHNINLTRNNFAELKKDIFFAANLVDLQKIYLNKVGLEKIDDLAFNKLLLLQELDLSSNALKQVPSGSFASIRSLKILNLDSNYLSVLSSNSFPSLSNLKYLSLSKNRIQMIKDDAFKGLSNLETLKLDDNQLENVVKMVFLPLPKLHSISLSGNQWKCNCNMKPIREFFLTNSQITIDRPRCSNNQQVWTQLALSSFKCIPNVVNLGPSSMKVDERSPLTLECGLLFGELLDSESTIEWQWKNMSIKNNSKGCGEDCSISDTPQQFIIKESIGFHQKFPKQKLKKSKLEISSVFEINSGWYVCSARNEVGESSSNITVDVLLPEYSRRRYIPRNVTETREYQLEDEESEESDRVMVGLILGILFGMFTMLILFGIIVVFIYRKKKRRERRHNKIMANYNGSSMVDENDSVNDKEMLASLPSRLTNVVNPIQKPPRLGVAMTNENSPQIRFYELSEIPKSRESRSNHYEHLESLLSGSDADEVMTQTSLETEIIHPSAYFRQDQDSASLEQISINSEGTEV